MRNLKFKLFSRIDFWFLIVVCIALFSWIALSHASPYASKAVILVHGKVYKVVSLDKNGTFDIRWKGVHLMTVQIKNGAVRAKESTCKNKICVHTGWISKDGQSIVCVPNRVIIYTKGAKQTSYDLMTSQ